MLIFEGRWFGRNKSEMKHQLNNWVESEWLRILKPKSVKISEAPHTTLRAQYDNQCRGIKDRCEFAVSDQCEITKISASCIFFLLFFLFNRRSLDYKQLNAPRGSCMYEQRCIYIFIVKFILIVLLGYLKLNRFFTIDSPAFNNRFPVPCGFYEWVLL